MSRKVYKLRNKITGLYFSKSSYKSFSKEGTKFSQIQKVRDLIDYAVMMSNRQELLDYGTTTYTADDFEIVKFELLEVGIVS